LTDIPQWQIDELRIIAKDPIYGRACIKAQSLLIAIGVEEFHPAEPEDLCNIAGIRTTEISDRHKNGWASDATASEAKPSVLSGEVELNLYPNPVEGVLYIQLDNTDVVNIEEVKIYDMYGRLLRTESDIRLRKTEIDIVGLSAGVYFVNCKLSNGEAKTKRIVKE
jgi:hypothetical protein